MGSATRRIQRTRTRWARQLPPLNPRQSQAITRTSQEDFWELRPSMLREKDPPVRSEAERLREGTLLAPEDGSKLSWSLWDGNYEKEFYWVLPIAGLNLELQPNESGTYGFPEPQGLYAVKCWPNAGIMNAVDGSGREWPYDPAKPLLVSLCPLE